MVRCKACSCCRGHAAVAQMLICSCTACDHARRRAVIIRCMPGLVDDGISQLCCAFHTVGLLGVGARRRSRSGRAHRVRSSSLASMRSWLPCTRCACAPSWAPLSWEEPFIQAVPSGKRFLALPGHTFLRTLQALFPAPLVLPLPQPKRLPSHPTSRWGGEEHFGYKLTM